jgi:hypothetical protein
MNEPHWALTTIIGAMTGWLLPHLVRGVVLLIRRFRRGVVDGRWFVYHVAKRDGRLRVEPSVWNIRKGLKSSFVVEEVRKGLETPMYKGDLLFERNFWLVRLNGVTHEEELLIRLISPIPTEDASTWGLYLGIDVQGKAIAGPIMVSREELSVAEASEFLMEKTRVYSKMRLLTA